MLSISVGFNNYYAFYVFALVFCANFYVSIVGLIVLPL